MAEHKPFIPAAVRAAGERANDIISGKIDPAAAAPPVKLVDDAVAPIVTENKPPEIVPFVDGEAQPTAAEGTVEFWMHKFNATNGRYKAELARVATLQAEISRLNGVIEGLKASGSQGKEIDNSADPLTDFPEELVEGVDQRIKAVTSAQSQQIQSLEAKIAAREQADKERFYDDLDKSAPSWETLNKDVAFVAWTQGNGRAGSGETFHVELMKAFSRLDARAVAAIFNLYPAGKKADLSGHVVPEKGPDGQMPITETISQKAIAKFYQDVQRGVYGPPGAERNAKVNDFEQRVSKARLAGLVTP